MPATSVLDPPFACARCGACCRQPGEVRLTGADSDVAAQFLHLDVHAFTAAYTRLREDRGGLVLAERADGACIFLEAGRCLIHPVKPRQCRDYPGRWRIPGDAGFCRARRGRQGIP